MTIREAYDLVCERLADAGIADAKSDSMILLEYMAGIGHDELYVHPEAELPIDKELAYMEAADRRMTHIPVQYITGRQEFMGLEYRVNENVLIPRFDTETLAEEALRLGLSHMNILDMCTGSGCILLSLLKYSHDCRGTGVDISDKALEVARENSERLGIEAEFILSDLFNELDPDRLKYDLIISNPPYIPSGVIPTLMEEVREYEPVIALDGLNDGLEFYRRIVSESPGFLRRGGQLMLEIGFDQAKDVCALMEEAGYTDISVVKDLGGNDRVVKGHWE